MIGTGERRRISAMTSRPLRSGRPKSRMITSGFSLVSQASAPAASSALATRYPAAVRLVRRKRRMGGSSSTTGTVYALGTRGDRLDAFGGAGDPEAEPQQGAGGVAPILRLDRAAVR